MKKVVFILLTAIMLVSQFCVQVSAEGEQLIGDVNADGLIDSLDAALVLKYDAALIDFTEKQLKVADYNADGVVDSLDASTILKYDSGYDFKVTKKACENGEAKYSLSDSVFAFNVSGLVTDLGNGNTETLTYDVKLTGKNDQFYGLIDSESVVKNADGSTLKTKKNTYLSLTIEEIINTDTFEGAASFTTTTLTTMNEESAIVSETQGASTYVARVAIAIDGNCKRYIIELKADTAKLSEEATIETSDTYTFEILEYADRSEIEVKRIYKSLSGKRRYEGTTEASVVLTPSNDKYLIKTNSITRQFSSAS